MLVIVTKPLLECGTKSKMILASSVWCKVESLQHSQVHLWLASLLNMILKIRFTIDIENRVSYISLGVKSKKISGYNTYLVHKHGG